MFPPEVGRARGEGGETVPTAWRRRQSACLPPWARLNTQPCNAPLLRRLFLGNAVAGGVTPNLAIKSGYARAVWCPVFWGSCWTSLVRYSYCEPGGDKPNGFPVSDLLPSDASSSAAVIISAADVAVVVAAAAAANVVAAAAANVVAAAATIVAATVAVVAADSAAAVVCSSHTVPTTQKTHTGNNIQPIF